MTPTGRIQKVASMGAAAGLALLGLVASNHGAFAGAPSDPSGYCNDAKGNEFQEITILTAPISLAIEIGDNGPTTSGSLQALENVHVGVCYSDTPQGTPSSLAGGDISIFGPQLGSGSTTTQNADGACLNDPGVVVQPNCGFNVTIAATPTTGSCGVACGAAVTVSIPVELCAGLVAGVHQVGSNCSQPGPVNTTVGLGETGLILSSFGVSPGPNGTLGVSTPTTTLYIDGIAEPFTLGAGVTTGTVGAGVTQTGGPFVCLSPLGCPGAFAAVAGGPLAVLVLPVVGTVNVTPPFTPLCEEVNYNATGTCPPPPYALP
jgi:hypothetical protein